MDKLTIRAKFQEYVSKNYPGWDTIKEGVSFKTAVKEAFIAGYEAREDEKE